MTKITNKTRIIISLVSIVISSLYNTYSAVPPYKYHKYQSTTRIPVIRHILAIPTFLKSFRNTAVHKQSFSNFDLPVSYKILAPYSVEGLRAIIKQARAQKRKISLMGAGKSQGGQISTGHALMIDMRNLNTVIALDTQQKTVTVQAGITWATLQKILNKHGLAVQAMQSYADFTVGGSLSVNAHGQDFHAGTVGDSVLSCTLLTAQGEFISVEPQKDPILFKLLVGGYGLFGIITQVTLKLTDNVLLKKQVQVLKTQDYFNYFLKCIKNNTNVALHSARLSIAPHTLFDKVLSITYTTHNTQKVYQALKIPRHILRDKLFFDMLRLSTVVKNIRFPLEYYLEKQYKKTEFITRNNAMHATIAHLENNIKSTRDILQEYFIPVAHINQFLVYLKQLVLKNKINLLNATIRFVKKVDCSFLSYAPQDSFAVVLYINVKDTREGYFAIKQWTQQVINYVDTLGGTYYLPYQLFGSYDQLRNIYPQFDNFIQYKKAYDPEELFVNQLYLTYA